MKEKVDSYLLEHLSEIQQLRDSGEIRWQLIANKISKKLNGEYVRDRFRHLTKKMESSANTSTRREHLVYPPVKYTYSERRSDDGSIEIQDTVDRKLSDDEIFERYGRDKKTWKIVQVWFKDTEGGFKLSVNFAPLKNTEALKLDDDFINRISKIQPLSKISQLNETSLKPKASLLIPKQDAHWNKKDISGSNLIEERFKVFTETLLYQLENVTKTHSLEKITYIIGSDEFNSEATGETTRGTPQENILSYNTSFEKICDFNIETINLLRYYSPNVEVVLLNGNHDHNVGWHLAHLLKQVFKKNTSIYINSSLENTKLVQFHKNLVLLNHGDAIKPKDLASKFPIIAKDKWSDFSNFFVICGDKHHEVAHDFHGIMFYQVPQLSNAKSKWDDKMGFITSKAELLTFLFEEEGLYNILRKQIK